MGVEIVEVNDDTLYILDLGSKKMVFDTKGEAIEELERNVAGGVEVDSIEVTEFDMSEDEWRIREVPWRDVVARVLEGRGREG